ncbi:MAG: hemolysin III family protein [Brevibacterium sp.]|uniref:PAQR family membrane homeostasis protein TrhA n=1 Tax=Brevibacterium sp. TaxID=1701 RepID=UPI002648D746|nr:hemolysin III family protein [Brevibacterium sp.]MDN5806258.1 hemolysin III family protein [Brevibacterium sp.]MDN5832786.1 hemolysin III family protein [Brevibacterium sp.]MDN5875379.1 hemolysin III family protein [Brevibacterium sp.]MDN5910427.1 hemolysin III family protein [Brevibacterium sp.]MDN6123322.1 hemolysin III family protein [Brevibacterium sp.]
MNAPATEPSSPGSKRQRSAGSTPPAESRSGYPIHIARRRSALRRELDKLAGQVKPKLRGWFHAGAFPLAMFGGLALVIISPTIESRIAAAIFAITGMLLFGTSAVYHRGRWRTRARLILRRLDHANIFLITAGTYTPLAVLTLRADQTILLLSVLWGAAILGTAFRTIFTTAPRWLFVPIYVGFGVAGVGYIPQIWASNPAVGILVVAGGVCYVVGAVIYGIKKPNPSPKWLGFHEIFHILTVAGYGCHLAALLVAAVAAY